MCIARAAKIIDDELNISEFNSIKIDDREIIQSYNDRFQPLSCEYSFANIYCWQEPYNNSWGIYKGRLVIYDGVNRCSFLPLGKEMTPKELVLFSKDMEKNGMGTDIGVVSLQYIEKYPEIEQFYTITDERDSAEYLYSVDSLCDLRGAKLHKKRNLIAQFHKKYPDFSVKLMSAELNKEAKILADEIFNGHERFLKGIEDEHTALMKAFYDFDKISLEGLCLMVGDDLAAFSIFTPLNHDTYDIHFEKACIKFKGAAQVINHETAKYLRGKCQYLNKEQDLGVQGLRQAKMSYAPENILMFHTLIFNQSK
jgi:hypothetical protein